MKDLGQALKVVDSTQSSGISFDVLGEFFHQIGVYKVLYNPAYGLRISPEGELSNAEMKYNNGQFHERLNREALFHLNLWYSINRMHKPTVDRELLLELVAMFHDIQRHFSDELLHSIEGRCDPRCK